MRRLLWPAILFIIISSCSNPGHVPGNVIQKDSMVSVLWDIIQADQFSTLYLSKDSAKINVKTETMKLYQEVFQLHHISKEEFERSYHFYLDHPDISSVMFDSLSAMANRKRIEIYKAPPKPLVSPKPLVK